MRASRARLDGSAGHVELDTDHGVTPQGPVQHPTFFSGVLARPDAVAAGILAVADVASTRYTDPDGIKASRDPVVAASGDRLRFEAFSGCHGVYARFDLLEAGIDAGEIGVGTTNVDIGEPLRAALAAIPRTGLVHLGVGRDSLQMATLDAAHEERQVALPPRWVRGFAQVPGLCAGMTHAGTVPRPAAMTFAAVLPRTRPGPTVGIAVGPRGIVLRPDRGAHVVLAGTARLGAMRRVLRHIEQLDVYRHSSGASGWVVTMPVGRLTLLVSPDTWRGFSGEGALLISAGGSGFAAVLAALLAWEPVIDPAWLATATGLTAGQVSTGMRQLAASGRVGLDLTTGTFFHRELPVEAVEHPRAARARALVDAGLVRRDGASWLVGEGAHLYRVTSGGSCTCAWQLRYAGTRGLCSHALAVGLVR